jgi:hypothetical protein
VPPNAAQYADVKSRRGQAMTLEQLAYLSQIIGAGLVVASLVYVGRQLHQNTQTMRQNAAAYYLNLQDRLCGEVANNRDLAECWHKGASDFESLDEVDRQRAILFEQRAIAGWNQLFLLRQEGLVPDSQWRELIWSVKHFGSRQSAQISWNVSKGSFGKPFQDFISEHIA